MGFFNLYLGNRGNSGADGIDGLGVDDVSPESVDNPILSILNPSAIQGKTPLTFNRDSSASFLSRYGFMDWSRKSQITYYLTNSNDFSSWSDPFSRWSYIGATTDPFGGNNASIIELDVDTISLSGTGQVLEKSISGIPSNELVTVSFYVKVISGDISTIDFTLAPNATRHTASITSEWTRIIYPISLSSITSITINPRGLDGDQVALYAAQVESGETASTPVITESSSVTVNQIYKHRFNKDGYLLEDAKSNLCLYSNDLTQWTQSGLAVSTTAADPFRNTYQSTTITTSSELSYIEGNTATLTNGVEYSVSFWITPIGGIVSDVSVSLGGGVSQSITIPDERTRVSVKCVAGASNTIKIDINSVIAIIVIECIQIETGEVSSFIYTSGQSRSRDADEMSFAYAYAAPDPALWSLTYTINGIYESSDKKYVFSNGETSTDEFSIYYEDDELKVNNGGNIVGYAMINYSSVAVTYDGSDVRFYSGQNLLSTQSSGSTTNIATTGYIGYNGTDGAISAQLLGVKFYDVELSANNLRYLLT